MAENKTNYDEIQDEYLENIIHLAYKNAEAIDTQELLEADDAADDEIPVDAKDAAFRMFLEKMEQEEKKNARQTRIIQWKRVLPRVVNAAACIVLILGIAAPFAVANVEAIRVRVMELLIDIRDDHTELIFEEDQASGFYVPTEWHGNYYPSYIPDGYTLKEVGQLNHYVRYQNSAGSNIFFDEYDESDAVNLNSENAELSYVNINGSNALVIEQEDYILITWSVEDRFFTLEVWDSKDVALAIARSVRRITD